jgi:hypothetical protein
MRLFLLAPVRSCPGGRLVVLGHYPHLRPTLSTYFHHDTWLTRSSKLTRVTSRLAHAAAEVRATEQLLAKQRANLRQLAMAEIRRGVSASRVAAELGMSRTAVGNWASDAGLELRRQTYSEPLEQDE